MSESIDISPKKDGGVLKKILKEGEGTEVPPLGCKVSVHYVGKLLDGTVFDSSRDRNEPFQFDLGTGTVIKAWDIGVATMKKGELAILTCASEYAYGSTGSPPTIPPNSTLEFEVEVISWVGEDLSPNKDLGITRFIVTPGEGHGTPKDMSLVEVHIVGKLESRVFEERDVSFRIGEGCEEGIIDGVERALQKFKKNETSRLIIEPKYAFGGAANEKFNIPPNSTVEYTVTLKSFEKTKESWAMDEQERIDQAKLLKGNGTNYFKAGKYQLAAKMYNKMNEILKDNNDKDLEGAMADEQKELNLCAHLNLALCYLKLSREVEARDSCNAAIEIDPNSVKAYFRRGQALLELSEPELALADFEKVLSLEPTNKAAVTQIAFSKKRIVEQKSKEKKIYANMFAKFAKRDTEV